jgi:hypothetical protein
MAISKKRVALLCELERIVGSECYNSKTQNWGPNGRFEGEGRFFRYPMTFTDQAGKKIKPKRPYDDLSAETKMSGRYTFGTNELGIMRALDKVVSYLEENHSLNL